MNNLPRPRQRESGILHLGILLTYEMCPIREGQKWKDFVNLFILIFKDAPNRKLHARANLQVISRWSFDEVSVTLPDG